ncbi:NUDIX hydrolase [Actinomyces oricola]|uniref:NUDIX hydrolase n=1 Tax=Actinomyces oricola TaxID=206043 RepID=UPI000FFF2684|nr:NUDIX domain-containing protein [Actinomyces oricola]
MATPEFILSLREKIGHEQLWLPGVSVVVLDDEGRVLLGRRADNGRWAVVSGIPEPGEQPGAAVVRECIEETGIVPELLGVCGVEAGTPLVFPNGDRCVFMDICFAARTGDPHLAHPADEESTQVGWFDPGALPEPVVASTPPRIRSALAWLADPAGGASFR